MKFPLRSTVQIGRYVASQKDAERYPLVLMLEPTLGCNIACIGCGKIREYESNKARLTVEECLDSGVQCPAPVVSICGGEPLIFKGIEDVVDGFLEMKKNIQLCTNALRLEEMLDRFTPNPRLTWVVHLDGMREIHDYICDYPGLWDVAISAIKAARATGFRVTTNTTTFKETEVDDVIEMMRYLTDEVGIDGMLVAPGYQYSQIDPNLTMTRAEHEEKFRAIRAAVRKHGYRWLASPIYQDFLTGERMLALHALGIDHPQPVRLEGPVLPAHRRDLPDLRSAHRRHGMGALRAGERPALRALRHPLRLRALGDARDDRERQGDGAEPRMDAALEAPADADRSRRCALEVEERLLRKGGVGGQRARPLAHRGAIPDGPLVSFGLAGALVPGLEPGTLITADASRRRGGRRDLGRGSVAGAGRARRGALLGASGSSTIRTSGRRSPSGPAPSPSTWRAASLAATGRLRRSRARDLRRARAAARRAGAGREGRRGRGLGRRPASVPHASRSRVGAERARALAAERAALSRVLEASARG